MKNNIMRIADMIASPFAHFSSPEEVLVAPGLDGRDKLAILRTMELDATELAVATSENMPGPGDSAEDLKRIRDAIRSLQMNGA